MIVITQILLILAVLTISAYGLRDRRTQRGRAWKKLALCALVAVMIIAILFPNTTNDAARLVGVGRGADLLVYLLAIAFIGFALNDYLHRQEDKDSLYRVARRVAIIDAEKRYNDKINKQA